MDLLNIPPPPPPPATLAEWILSRKIRNLSLKTRKKLIPYLEIYRSTTPTLDRVNWRLSKKFQFPVSIDIHFFFRLWVFSEAQKKKMLEMMVYLCVCDSHSYCMYAHSPLSNKRSDRHRKYWLWWPKIYTPTWQQWSEERRLAVVVELSRGTA